MVRQFNIEFEAQGDLAFHLPNERDRNGNPIAHRKAITGTDREGNASLMSVIGIMPTVVHGFADGVPYTLAIFEWKAEALRQGLRFKRVSIEMEFSAKGDRGDAEQDAKELRQLNFSDNYWDPEVMEVAPEGTQFHNYTKRKVGGKSNLELGFSASFAQFFNAGPKWTFERDTSRNISDAIQVTGQGFVVGSDRNRSNAVRWIMLENESQRSGVPTYLRTAVLLKRMPNDNGIFHGTVRVETHVSLYEDFKEKMYKYKGQIKTDEPVIFNPKILEQSTFDPHQLGNVDLQREFRIYSLKPPVDGDDDGDEKGEEENGLAEISVSI
ncbi:hypothetical protein FPOAC2_03833 [Fusarium poae]